MPDAACGGLSGLIPPVHSPGLSGVPHPHGPLLAATGGQEVWQGAVVRRGDAPGMDWVEGVDAGCVFIRIHNEDTSAQLLMTGDHGFH